MKKAWVSSARNAEVLEAARSWREANAIDAETFAAIEDAYPQAQPPLSAAWRALIFFLVSVAVHAVFFGFMELARSERPWTMIAYGAVLAAAAELLRGSRFSGNGGDAAASFWAIGYLLVGAGVAWNETRGANAPEELATFLLALAVLLFASACAHWGFSVYGIFAAAAFFGLLAQFPAARLTWALAAGILLAGAYGRLDRSFLPPPHRVALAGVLAVAACALYAAVNRYSLDLGWIEALRGGFRTSEHAPPPWLRLASAAATALVPPAFLLWGIRTRRTLVLDLGLAFTALSLVTLRQYVHLAPLWVLLTTCGTLLILGAMALNRRLRRAPGGERAGFTADPLFSAKRAERIQVGAVFAGFAGSAPEAGRTEAGQVTTGGGGFGGAGASGEY